MTPEFVIQIIRQALMMAFWLAAPLLAVGFVVGIVISLVQIATSIQDSGFSTIPRLAAFLLTFILALPWMVQKLTSYTVVILGDISRYGAVNCKSRSQHCWHFWLPWRGSQGFLCSFRCRASSPASRWLGSFWL